MALVVAKPHRFMGRAYKPGDRYAAPPTPQQSHWLVHRGLAEHDDDGGMRQTLREHAKPSLAAAAETADQGTGDAGGDRETVAGSSSPSAPTGTKRQARKRAAPKPKDES